jgi:sulfide dehydrogenase cytochrome subunit
MTSKHLLILAACSLTVSVAGADVASIAENCDGCHGSDGVSQWSDMPTIAGLSMVTIEDNMFAYADEARPCAESEYRQGDTSRAATTMCAVAAELGEDDITAIAEYYEGKSFVAAKQEFDAALAEQGKAVHESACNKCHTAGGSDPADDAGILAGQWMGYMKTSFAQFASGERTQPKSMKTKMDDLSEADVEALVHFYASQQ